MRGGNPGCPLPPPPAAGPGLQSCASRGLLRGATPGSFICASACQVTPMQPPLRGAVLLPPRASPVCPARRSSPLQASAAPVHPPESVICVSSSCKVHLYIPLPGGTLAPTPLGAESPARTTCPCEVHPCTPLPASLLHAPGRCPRPSAGAAVSLAPCWFCCARSS